MRKEKMVSNTRRVAFVHDARAGLSPESENIENEVRTRTVQTARIIRIAKSSLGSVTNISDEQAITNILADLRHYCECQGLGVSQIRQSR